MPFFLGAGLSLLQLLLDATLADTELLLARDGEAQVLFVRVCVVFDRNCLDFSVLWVFLFVTRVLSPTT